MNFCHFRNRNDEKKSHERQRLALKRILRFYRKFPYNYLPKERTSSHDIKLISQRERNSAVRSSGALKSLHDRVSQSVKTFLPRIRTVYCTLCAEIALRWQRISSRERNPRFNSREFGDNFVGTQARADRPCNEFQPWPANVHGYANCFNLYRIWRLLFGQVSDCQPDWREVGARGGRARASIATLCKRATRTVEPDDL